MGHDDTTLDKANARGMHAASPLDRLEELAKASIPANWNELNIERDDNGMCYGCRHRIEFGYSTEPWHGMASKEQIAFMETANPKMVLKLIAVVRAATLCPEKLCDIHYHPEMRKALDALEE